MSTAVEDVVALLEYAATRLQDRMVGLTDDEWSWRPVDGDDRVTIRWRLDHLAETLDEPRNREWFGADPDPAAGPAPAVSADEAVRAVGAAAARFAALARGLGADAADPLGSVAGPYAADSRLSLVLHVVDELVHHAAEAALLRDLWAARS
ncbi:DinB family protein [Curtobacterium pusillum]|uniref:DinB family protein n=1 Tax=Curtobacterium pusillum TaxID=69373 RepID=UPI00119F4F41|nr:DinB family protein [Curtobacterium pusillum]